MTKNTSFTPAQRTRHTRKLYAEKIANLAVMVCLYTLQIVAAVWVVTVLLTLLISFMGSGANENIFYVNLVNDVFYVLMVTVVIVLCLFVPSCVFLEYETIRDTASDARRIARITVKRQLRKFRN